MSEEEGEEENFELCLSAGKMERIDSARLVFPCCHRHGLPLSIESDPIIPPPPTDQFHQSRKESYRDLSIYLSSCYCTDNTRWIRRILWNSRISSNEREREREKESVRVCNFSPRSNSNSPAGRVCFIADAKAARILLRRGCSMELG